MDLVLAGAFIDGSSDAYSNTRVLGVRLRKFCLWHRLNLNTVDSPVMRKGAITMRDLRIAVGICRLRPFSSRVRKPWLVPTWIYFRALIASIRFRKPAPATSTHEPKQNALQRALRKQVNAFLDYAGDYLSNPEFTIIPPEHGRNYTPRTPRGRFDDCIEHVGELIQWGIPEKDAWGMPIGKANVYRIMAMRSSGLDVDIVTEEEKEFMKNVPESFRTKA